MRRQERTSPRQRVTDLSELEPAICDAVAHEGPALVEVMTDSEFV